MPKPVNLPTLSGFGIQPPVYIHKIARGSNWVIEENVSDSIRHAVETIFKDSDYMYSFWLVGSDLDLYCVAASLNADRDAPNEQINFIWLTHNDLEVLGLTATQSQEGKCIYAQKLHYNILVEPNKAQELCSLLMKNKRESVRCTKGAMKLIVTHNLGRGCKAYEYDNPPQECLCEMKESTS